MLSKLYIGNLSFLVNEQELRELFTQAGGVEDVRIITDQFSGHSRGFGFVQMASTEEAQKAIGMFHGHSLKERALVVAEARPQRQPGGRGDGGWSKVLSTLRGQQGSSMGEDAGKRAGSIELSPRVQARLRTYCRAQGLQETEFLAQVILDRLEQEEGLERCCQAWDALLNGAPPSA